MSIPAGATHLSHHSWMAASRPMSWHEARSYSDSPKTRVSGLKTAQANQKWLPFTMDWSCLPVRGPAIARPRTFHCDCVSVSTIVPSSDDVELQGLAVKRWRKGPRRRQCPLRRVQRGRLSQVGERPQSAPRRRYLQPPSAPRAR